MSELVVASPLAGWLVALDAVPDPVFAERMLGDGIAIDPVDGVVCAPVAGRVVSVHPAGHAVTIESDAGAVLLIHVGLDTVALAGAGFEPQVMARDRVAPGDPLLRFDLDAVGARATSLVTPVIVTNGEEWALEGGRADRAVAIGDPLFTLRRHAPAAIQHSAGEENAERRLRVPLRHGLHARPAARIADLARGFDAAVELVAADGRRAAATSPVAVLALALPHGAALTVHGRGAAAGAAVAAVAELIEGGMGEGAPLSADLPGAPVPSVEVEDASPGSLPPTLSGVAAAPGLAIGPAFRWHRVRIAPPEQGRGIGIERAALAAARDEVRAGLTRASRAGGAAAAIATAHLAFLDDPGLVAASDARLVAGASAGRAWADAIAGFAAPLAASGDPRFAERIDDLNDLADRVLAALSGAPTRPMPPAGAILVADELFPSDMAALGEAGIAGIATAGGGPTSHVAIIAAGLGLPMLAALGPALGRVADGAVLVLDTAAASLAIDPDPAQVAAVRDGQARDAAFRKAAQARADELAVTADGVRIEVFANLGSITEARGAAAAGAEGCGLLRTEFLFLERAAAPDEEEQRAEYQAIADALQGRPLIVRTLDIGADKPAPYLPMPAEENPALGLRGLRLGLARPALLATQFRALLGVAGDIRIMLPMVTEPAELAAAARLLEEAATTLGRPVPPLGVMIETPAAALLAGALAERAAFLSIGSNDLSQYALAMDRGNPAVAARLDALHPAVLRLIAGTAAGAKAHGRIAGLCGGAAADPLALPILIGLGLTELSVPVAAIAETKARVRRVTLGDCRALGRRVLDLADAGAVRAEARAFWEGRA